MTPQRVLNPETLWDNKCRSPSWLLLFSLLLSYLVFCCFFHTLRFFLLVLLDPSNQATYHILVHILLFR
jgi:hypothetical protein